jgi:hypothetical protein
LPVDVKSENIFKRLLNRIKKFFDKKWNVYFLKVMQ